MTKTPLIIVPPPKNATSPHADVALDVAGRAAKCNRQEFLALCWRRQFRMLHQPNRRGTVRKNVFGIATSLAIVALASAVVAAQDVRPRKEDQREAQKIYSP